MTRHSQPNFSEIKRNFFLPVKNDPIWFLHLKFFLFCFLLKKMSQYNWSNFRYFQFKKSNLNFCKLSNIPITKSSHNLSNYLRFLSFVFYVQKYPNTTPTWLFQCTKCIFLWRTKLLLLGIRKPFFSLSKPITKFNAFQGRHMAYTDWICMMELTFWLVVPVSIILGLLSLIALIFWRMTGGVARVVSIERPVVVVSLWQIWLFLLHSLAAVVSGGHIR